MNLIELFFFCMSGIAQALLEGFLGCSRERITRLLEGQCSGTQCLSRWYLFSRSAHAALRPRCAAAFRSVSQSVDSLKGCFFKLILRTVRSWLYWCRLLPSKAFRKTPLAEICKTFSIPRVPDKISNSNFRINVKMRSLKFPERLSCESMCIVSNIMHSDSYSVRV